MPAAKRVPRVAGLALAVGGLLVPPAQAATLKVGAEVRYRLELRDDFTFNDAFEDDALQLIRTRLQADLAIGKPLRFFWQPQSSRRVVPRLSPETPNRARHRPRFQSDSQCPR